MSIINNFNMHIAYGEMEVELDRYMSSLDAAIPLIARSMSDMDMVLETRVREYLAFKQGLVTTKAQHEGKRVIPVAKLSAADAIRLVMSVYIIRLVNTSQSISADMNEMPLCLYYPFDSNGMAMAGLYSETGVESVFSRLLASADIMDQRVTMKSLLETLRCELIRQGLVAALTYDANYTIVANGIYNHQTRQLESFRPSYVAFAKISVRYNALASNVVIRDNVTGQNWDAVSWVRELANGDADTELLFWQIMRSAVNSAGISQKVLVFFARKGNNGKGTYGQILKNLVGVGNFTSVALDGFGQNFGLEPLVKSRLNIADENVVDAYIDNSAALKAITTGDDVIVNRKNKSMLSMRFNMTNIQMMNDMPRTKDKTDSLYRRFLIIEFLTSFTNNGENPRIKQDYIYRTDVLEGILKRVLDMDVFTEFIIPKRSLQALDKYREENDPVVEFWNEFGEQFAWKVVPSAFAYKLFCAWFEQNNPRGIPVKRRSFLNSTEQWMSDVSHGWEYNASRDTAAMRLSTGDMDADEPLITDYNLTDYMDKSYSGSDNKKKRNFTRPTTRIRGFKRL